MTGRPPTDLGVLSVRGVGPVLVYATRYALGRRSGAAQDVAGAIAANLEALKRDKACLNAIIRDISETEDLGMPCDQESWRRALTLLQGAKS